MLYFFDLDQDSDFRPIGPKNILIQQALAIMMIHPSAPV
ncbi:hypothetical protein Rleg5DRAFT_4924 [Rhizobium leguminosarum bv. viciae WSM1455]|nr:hypothetical protein Rleg5DRAFT_4924 [Rhizobium leguminosarum bv. viciae WSM1455]